MKDFITTNDVVGRGFNCAIRHNAHLGFYGLCPNYTLPAFEFEAECHFATCIVVPKVSLDGVFGTEIDGYTYDVCTWDDSKLDVLKNLVIDTNLCRVGIEYKFGEYTREIAAKIKAAGFLASAWAIGQRDFDEYERLISYGLNEFTEDFHCSIGLNY